MVFKKIIYLDVDNTIFPAEKRMAEIWNEHYKLPNENPMDYKKITSWNAGIDKDTVGEIFSRIDFYDPSKIELYDGVQESLKKAKEMGYKIVIFSKGTLTNIASKCVWLENILGKDIDAHVFMGSSDVKMGKSSLNMDGGIMIDDHIENLVGNNTMYNICAKMSEQEVDWNKDFANEKMTLRKWSELPKILTTIQEFESLMYYNLINR